MNRTLKISLLSLLIAGGCQQNSAPTSPETSPTGSVMPVAAPAGGVPADGVSAGDPPGATAGVAEKAAAPSSSRAEPDRIPPEFAVTPQNFVRPQLTEDELRAGWISLLDGFSLFGWEIPPDANWHVSDGCIVADSGRPSLLMTPFQFADIEFRCEFHLAEGGNSGIFLRCAEQVLSPVTDTYELNLCDGHPTHGTGSFVGRYVAENVPRVEGAWHGVRVLCEGPRLQVWLDDAKIADFTDTSESIRLTGTLGLQLNAGRIAFRHVAVRPLGGRDLFNGKDITGWRVVAGSKSTFDVAEGAIQVRSGPGFLETHDTFGDFLLHAEVRTSGAGLNSGIFFRAEPGTAEAPSNGYEMQIHNGILDDDLSRPADYGTGAVFRRVQARCVVARDGEWWTQTLIAQGNRIATWVNGYQVVNWRDDRLPDSNPRRGRRDAAGHISLQGHDATTDLEFRTVRIH